MGRRWLLARSGSETRLAAKELEHGNAGEIHLRHMAEMGGIKRRKGKQGNGFAPQSSGIVVEA
jgi:hypothetical protein